MLFEMKRLFLILDMSRILPKCDLGEPVQVNILSIYSSAVVNLLVMDGVLEE